MGIINLELMKEPLNWVIVLLMVLTGSLAVHYIAISVQNNGQS